MKIRLYMSAVLLFALTQLCAQQEYSKTPLFKTPTLKSQNYKYQLDIDVKDMLRRGTNTTLILKKKIAKRKKNLNFLRLNINWNARNYSENENSIQDDRVERSSRSLRINTGLGIEKQIRHNGFVHYYGVDALINFSFSNNEIESVFSGTNPSEITNTSRDINRYFGVGINPFFGIKYYLNPRLSVGVETGLQFSYARRYGSWLKTSVYVDNGMFIYDEFRRDRTIGDSFFSSFNNLRFLTIGYTF